MKRKKQLIKLFLGLFLILFLIACIIIQIYIGGQNKKLKKEKEKYENLQIKTDSGKQLKTNYIKINDHNFYIKVPTDFKQLTDESVQKKYNGDIPDIVFSNDETTVNIAVSITSSSLKNHEVKKYQKMIEALFSDSQILASDYYQVEEHNIGQIKLISQASDTDIYNNIIFFSYDEKLVIIAFNCMKELQNEWEKVGDFIIESLFFKES